MVLGTGAERRSRRLNGIYVLALQGMQLRLPRLGVILAKRRFATPASMLCPVILIGIIQVAVVVLVPEPLTDLIDP